MYSNDKRRCFGASLRTGSFLQKSYWRNTFITSVIPKACSAGINFKRSEGIGWWRLMAKLHWLSSKKRTNPFANPTLLTVIRLGLQAYPHSAVRAVVARSTLSKLSKGSPCPIKTMFVNFSRSGRLYIWFSISAADKEAVQPWRPVIQKAQCILHPTWQDTHSVARSAVGIYTVSI